MDIVTESFPLWFWAVALGVAFCAGMVKGIVGFALPLIIVSGIGSFAAPELALAGLILPTVVTNVMQAFRTGVAPALRATRQFRRFLVIGGITLLLGAQLVPLLAERTFLLMLGIPIVLFILSQMLGWTPAQIERSKALDSGVAVFAGFMGGTTGVWGPTVSAYLTALNTPKAIQMQVQGTIYLLGALALVVAHVASGILTMTTALFSLCLVPPSIAGMIVGTAIQDRINQSVFRRATLFVLLIAGLNLVRRGIFV